MPILLLIVLMSKNRSGFTLVELIVVIMVITTLLTLGITSYSSVQRNARNTKRKNDLKNLQVALEAYRAEIGSYPSTGGSANWRGGVGCHPSWSPNVNWIPGLVPNYIDSLPLDPRHAQANSSSSNPVCGLAANANQNCYIYTSNGVDYKLMAH